MAKGSVMAKLSSLGLVWGYDNALHTPTAPLKKPAFLTSNNLQEPMFGIHSRQEFNEVVYLDRQYCFENQFSPPPNYGTEKKLLLWVRRATRHRNDDPENPAVISTTCLNALFRIINRWNFSASDYFCARSRS